MLNEKWFACKVELPAGINDSTIITIIFQCFGEDDEKYYDVEGTGYYKELCKRYT